MVSQHEKFFTIQVDDLKLDMNSINDQKSVSIFSFSTKYTISLSDKLLQIPKGAIGALQSML